MAVQINMDRVTIQNAPGSWEGGVDTFRRLLISALEAELRTTPISGSLDDHAVLRIDLPPVNDLYDMQDTAREIARRILQAVRQSPE